ncbi:phospholipid/cholesterol/gamma-HCH transport system permease protein [Magnetospirillum fulvum]|uniref:Phospholipid/cholesterol/gamma-HCH transport system permease protein n=1 Tax=Magnetospirillum fulvum TaxID=1082 RepID=A0A1H6HA16_MAGFU|nr:phospholipid/cholesterol/gamma-HCH transport system permease protein [Magnetospirillum fulvum]
MVTLSGDWIACARGVEGDVAAKILKSGAQAIVFQSDRLGQWDSALIATLSAVRDAARDRGVEFDQSGLPAPARKLLGLIEDSKPIPPPSPQPPLLERVGLWGLRVFDEATEAVALIGSTCLRGAAAIRGRSTMRGVDLLDCMKDAGAAALPIVTVINFLVGGILAFVGAVQLRRFGADIYVASMVGIAVVREMAALMTAIIMAGRTGGAYAASLATMQGNEEIDSLRTVGIPVFDYLVLPRVLALTAMMPILYLYGCAVGIFGGFVVSVLTLNLSPIVYVETTRIAVSGNQFMLGFAKSIAFGTLIAIAGCRVGLRAGRSSADIGRAATSAVVVSIIGIIVLDAVFALCANALGI